MPQQSKFTEEFKKEAVRLAMTSGRTQGEVARELGISLSTLKHWIRLYRDQAIDEAPQTVGNQNRAAGLEWLRREIKDKEAEMERSLRQAEDLRVDIEALMRTLNIAREKTLEIRSLD